MIIGRGLMAKALAGIDNDKYLFYVNGISNSVIEKIDENNFEDREIKKIAQNIGNKTFVYFSTALVNVPENYKRPYVLHKHAMECLTKELFSSYTIIRTSNLVGHNPWNKHTLFNFLYNSLEEGTEINVIESIIRNVLDVDHFITLFAYYLDQFPQKNNIVNIVNPVSYNMGEILMGFENVFSKKFIKNHTEVSIAQFDAPCDFSLSLVNACNINLENYLATVIKKYYHPVIKQMPYYIYQK